MNSSYRTDLALETLTKGEEIPGISVFEESRDGISLTRMEVTEEGAKTIGKPAGSYVTLELEPLLRREENAFTRSAEALGAEIRKMLRLKDDDSVLVVGLGNRAITPDAVGPEAADYTLVTRHLRKELPEYFSEMRSVAAVCSGVLGTTGMESSAVVTALCRELNPSAVIAVDALAARDCQRLCRTVQLSDSGIVPGSGVGNARAALNRESLGVPVIAVGVPTVVDAVTLTLDMAERAGIDLNPASLPQENLIVTPRDIDKLVHDAAKLVAYGINLALQEKLTVQDLDMLLD